MEEQIPSEDVKVLKLQRGGVPLKDWMGGNKINQGGTQDNTKLNYSPRVGSASAKKMEEATLLRRKQAIANSKKVMGEKGEFSKEAFASTAMGDKARFFPNELDNPLDEYANPFKLIGDMGDNIGHAFAGSGSTGQKLGSLAAPIVVGALGGLAKGTTTAQFANNILNPLAGTGSLLKNATAGIRGKVAAGLERRFSNGEVINSAYRSGSSNNELLHQKELFGEPVRPSFTTDPNWSVKERVDAHANFLETRKAWDAEHKAWLDAPRGTEEQNFAVGYGNKWNQQWLADPIIQDRILTNNFDLLREGKKMIDPNHQFKTKIPTQRELLELRRLGVGPKDNYGVQVGNIPDPAYDNVSNKAFVHTDPNALLMESTSVHEGGHDLTHGQQGFGSRAKQLTQDLYGGAEGIAELKRKSPQQAWEQIDYLSNPAETRERTQELRFFYNMKPSDHVSLERAGEIMRDVQNDVTPVSPNWGRMFKSDKAVADLFNKLFTPAAVVGAGIMSQKKSQP